MIYVDVQWATLLIAVLLPVLVAVVKAKGASSAWGAWILAALSAVTAVLTVLLANADQGFPVKDAVILFVEVFVVAVASHFGFWKPVGATGSAGKVAALIPGGLGASKDDAA